MKKVMGVGVFLVFVLCSFVSVPLHAQVTGATLSGTVTDASGAVIANAQVSIRNTATGISKDTTTDSAGFYAARTCRQVLMKSRLRLRDSILWSRMSRSPWALKQLSTYR